MQDKTRREFLELVLGTSAALLLGGCEQGDRKLGVVGFYGERRTAVGQLRGSGLAGRLALDLSKLDKGRLNTATERFFIRTRRPDRLQARKNWTISLEGKVAQRKRISVASLADKVKPMGLHLLECSGNSRNRAFGLISAATWSGIPLADLLTLAQPDEGASRVRISGFDLHSQPARGSRAGADWIFTPAQLKAAGAFLATEMNGKPLPRDHGAPVRLIVPGWYGCCCIKWVEQIEWTTDDAAATDQMREFASRTHQRGVPRKARDFAPASIDTTAMPVRIERWRTPGGKIYYRVIGILWGGDKTTRKLQIRFQQDEPYVDVERYLQQTHATWSLWSHTWRPTRAGRFAIRLRVDDPQVRTRRLDSGFYLRYVKI